MKKLLKYLIILLVLLALIAVALMAISPSQLFIEESETVDAPPVMVYNMVNDFKKWRAWSPWDEMDPDAEHTYTSKTAGAGAQWTWKGNKEVGEGSQTIAESKKGEFIKMILEFGGFDGESESDWKFEDVDGKTKVTWGFAGGDTPFVFRPFNLLMKSGLVKTYKKGLNNIKEIAEKQSQEKVYDGYKINEVYVGEKHYIMNRQVVQMANMQQFYTQNLGALFMKAQGEKLEMDGMPSGLFFSWNETNGTTDMAAAIPLKEATSIPGTISQSLPDGKAVQVDYYGPYQGTEKAQNAISNYMDDHGLLVNYPIVQEYVTDPTTEKDPTKWLTKITYYTTNSIQ